MGWKVSLRFIDLTIHLYCNRIWELGVHFAWHQAHMEGNSPGNPSRDSHSVKHRYMRTAHRQRWYERREREVIAITCLSCFCSMMTCIFEHYIISEL